MQSPSPTGSASASTAHTSSRTRSVSSASTTTTSGSSKQGCKEIPLGRRTVPPMQTRRFFGVVEWAFGSVLVLQLHRTGTAVWCLRIVCVALSSKPSFSVQTSNPFRAKKRQRLSFPVARGWGLSKQFYEAVHLGERRRRILHCAEGRRASGHFGLLLVLGT